ncbi:MAG: endonuclease/exonuclease/phosphatase family protein [Burkholderiaceae bacterium]
MKSPHADPARHLSFRLLYLLGAAVVFPAAALSLLALLAERWWLADLFVHFRLQYLVIGLLGILMMAALRQPGAMVAGLVAFALNLGPAVAYFAPAPAPAGPAPGARIDSFRIAAVNIFYRNTNYQAVIDWIRRESPDVVVLVEATPRWREALRDKLPDYPFAHLVAKSGRSGKLVLSRIEPDSLLAVDPKAERSPVPIVTVRKNGVALGIAGVHTEWPMGEERTARRDREIRDLARYMRAVKIPMLAVGDLNLTPFSPRLQSTLDAAGLYRAAAGRGWLPTWPVFFQPAGIQIDHALFTDGIRIDDLRMGAGLGSDHRWQVIDLHAWQR